MAYIIEQKIKGRTYLYKVESYWDKTKKQPRQRRTYIGPKQNGNSAKTKQNQSSLVSKGFGNVFLVRYLSDKLGLTEILKLYFPENYQEILALAFYEIIEASALYLFSYWLEEHNLPGVKKLYSPDISKLCDTLGRSQTQRVDFTQKWIEHLKPIQGVFYDITSISSYSTNIDFVEWGYNRNDENLPQINMGVTFCQNRSLPINYNLYPGSIVDVTTLKNCIKYLKIFDLKDILLVLDRGFFSKANVLGMNSSSSNVSFVQPLPFSLKSVKLLIKRHKRILSDPSSAFKFNEEILHYQQSPFEFDGNNFEAHIFFNEKSEVDQKHHFLSALFECEEKFKNKTFKTLTEYLQCRKSIIPEKYREYFSLILYSEVARIMKEKKLFDTYTVKELFAELKKLKITRIKQNEPFLSEVSKKQRVIFDAFGIQEEALHSY